MTNLPQLDSSGTFLCGGESALDGWDGPVPDDKGDFCKRNKTGINQTGKCTPLTHSKLSFDLFVLTLFIFIHFLLAPYWAASPPPLSAGTFPFRISLHLWTFLQLTILSQGYNEQYTLVITPLSNTFYKPHCQNAVQQNISTKKRVEGEETEILMTSEMPKPWI